MCPHHARHPAGHGGRGAAAARTVADAQVCLHPPAPERQPPAAGGSQRRPSGGVPAVRPRLRVARRGVPRADRLAARQRARTIAVRPGHAAPPAVAAAATGGGAGATDAGLDRRPPGRLPGVPRRAGRPSAPRRGLAPRGGRQALHQLHPSGPR
ncbi:hypothetical protein G6F24_015480 [Rhizopus arrhizus]|nr:hypothetical protein G6F24_015480 [Rhizopus arrhizus]